MPPRPFPFALRIGTDIVRQSRIHDIITKPSPKGLPGTQLDAFLRRVFTEREQRDIRRRYDGLLLGKNTRLESLVAHLAGRFAAKEAAIKAIKPRKLTFMDIEILQQEDTRELYALIRDQSFVPMPLKQHFSDVRRLHLNNGSEQADSETGAIADNFSVSPRLNQVGDNDPAGQIAKISISHDHEYATAVCLAAEEHIPGDVGGEATARLYYNS